MNRKKYLLVIILLISIIIPSISGLIPNINQNTYSPTAKIKEISQVSPSIQPGTDRIKPIEIPESTGTSVNKYDIVGSTDEDKPESTVIYLGQILKNDIPPDIINITPNQTVTLRCRSLNGTTGKPLVGLLVLLKKYDGISWESSPVVCNKHTDSQGWVQCTIKEKSTGIFHYKFLAPPDGWSNLIIINVLPVAKFDIRPYVDRDAKRKPWGSSKPVPMIGGLIELNASSSVGSISLYFWDYGDKITEFTKEPISKHIYRSEGTFTVKLMVKDRSELVSLPIAKKFTIPKLQAGDIIFCRTKGYNYIPGFFTHCGIYIGDGKIVEVVKGAGHGLTPNTLGISKIKTWFYSNVINNRETCVAVYRVKTTPRIRAKAVQVATDLANVKPHLTYDLWSIFTNTKQQLGPGYYCSELVWAGYSIASGGEYKVVGYHKGIDTKYGRINLGNKWLIEGMGAAVTPSQIAEDKARVYYVASHWEDEG